MWLTEELENDVCGAVKFWAASPEIGMAFFLRQAIA
jgi:hypothetical protein